MDTTNYSIKKVSKTECESILKKHHYLGKQGYSFRSGKNYGLYKGDTLIGVAVFHGVSAWETVKGAFGLENKEQKGFWELGRLAIDPEHNEKNLGSWFVAKCIKLLRSEAEVRAIISYADTDFHTGGIYQALNFKYCGLTSPKKDFWVKQDDGTYKRAARGASNKNSTGEWRPRSRKYRYVLVYDKKLSLKWKEEPYPKIAAFSGTP